MYINKTRRYRQNKEQTQYGALTHRYSIYKTCSQQQAQIAHVHADAHDNSVHML